MVKKLVKGTLWFLFILIVSVNIFILLSGRFYLYKGIGYTYLSGKSGPTIYDKDKFYSSRLYKSMHPQPWLIASNAQQIRLTAEEEQYMEKYQTKSFLVFRGDSLIFEKYWDPHGVATVSNSFSAAKTVVGMLVGIALGEGKIKSLDDKVCRYIPEFSGKGKERVTIHDLLIMASGLDWSESGSNPLSDNAESYYGEHLKELIMRQKLITEPGKLFNYQSGNSQILAYVVEAATGKDLTQYADEKLWRPMGAESDAFWSLDRKNGDEKAFCCLYSTSRDFARLGKLINHYGNYNGKQLVPESFMRAMVSNPEMETAEGVPNTRYGLHVWTWLGYKTPVYYCRGIKGQYVIAIPAENLVIVRTGNLRAPKFTLTDDQMKNKALRDSYTDVFEQPTDLFFYVKLAHLLEQRR